MEEIQTGWLTVFWLRSCHIELDCISHFAPNLLLEEKYLHLIFKRNYQEIT